jgi:hypothetical protein
MSRLVHSIPPQQRCTYPAIVNADLFPPASAFTRDTSVNPASQTTDVDADSGYHVTNAETPRNTRDCDPRYVHHPVYGWLPADNAYLAMLAELAP